MDENFDYEWKKNETGERQEPELRDVPEQEAYAAAPQAADPPQVAPAYPSYPAQPPLYSPYATPYATAPQAAYQEQPKRKRTGLVVFLALLLVVAFAGVGILGGAVWRYMKDNDPNTIVADKPADDSQLQLASTPDGDNSAPSAEGALTPVEIHQKLQDANVAVQLYGGGRSGDGVVSEGSGVLIHEDGSKTYTYVVTCAHVLTENASVSIELEDGTRYDAEVVGKDSRTDVALLRVKKTGLHGATFGNSDMLKVGEPVYAIGNPGGIEFKGSFTDGIVSSIERPLKSDYTMVTIQHTAPINFGNSGGALINVRGEVVGINSSKIAGGAYEGMGFAIPSRIVKEVVDNLIARGYVPNRPKLGIRYLAASESRTGFFVLRANDLPSGSLIIAEINEDSALKGTDVRTTDIITHVNGKPLNKPEVLQEVIEKSKVGDTLKLTIARVNPQNYSVSSFEISVDLVEDKGAKAEPQTQPWYRDDQFENGFGW